MSNAKELSGTLSSKRKRGFKHCFTVLALQLCGDVDREVRQGVGFVDSLLKEETASAAANAAAAASAASASDGPTAEARSATASKDPITPAFVHLLAERLLVRNPYIKLLAVSSNFTHLRRKPVTFYSDFLTFSKTPVFSTVLSPAFLDFSVGVKYRLVFT